MLLTYVVGGFVRNEQVGDREPDGAGVGRGGPAGLSLLHLARPGRHPRHQTARLRRRQQGIFFFGFAIANVIGWLWRMKL